MYRTVLSATFLALLALALACAGLAVHGARLARHHLERTELAHGVLALHLELEALAYASIKQLTDGHLTRGGSGGSAAAADDLRAPLIAKLDEIRAGIAREAAFVGGREDETEELQRLARIERKLLDVMDQLAAAARLRAASDALPVPPELDEVLDREVDGRLRDLVDEAIAEERREVAAVQAEAGATLAGLVLASIAAAGVAVLLGVAALVLLLRRLAGPLGQLEAGARAVLAGDLAHRVPVRGEDEFASLGRSFNRMIEGVAASRAEAEGVRRGLEATVAERTAELTRANLRLRAADDTRRRFLADVSHELRTPLTVIRGEAEVTLRGPEPTIEACRAALVRIVEQSAITAGLVDDLLFMARNDGASPPRIQAKPAALAELARRACEDARVLAGARGVSVEPMIEAEPVVQGDPQRLRQLVMILLDNAIRYSEPGGTVRVVVAAGPAGAILQVIDRGIGIAEDELASVFERFYRGDAASRRNSAGSGLGLPLAKAIVEAHGGEITIESRLGEGTTVGVALPAGPRLRAVS